jgi:mono/diheme cytochrome c family protein
MIGPRPEAIPPAPRPTPPLLERGASLFRDRCAACHGTRGQGDGIAAGRLKVKPTDFTRAVFKLRSTPTGRLPTDEDLFTTLTRGLHGTPMLPWRSLEPEDRWALVLHLKSLSPRFRTERPGLPIGVPRPPSETDTLRAQGAALYHQLRCAACHGDAGAADGPATLEYAKLRAGRGVRVRDFTRGRFIRGTDLEDVYLTLRSGLDGTPMGAYDTLTAGELWSLSAYVRDLIRERPVHDLPPAGDRAEEGPRSKGGRKK